MTKTNNKSGLGLFLISLIICLLCLIFIPQYFWIPLPFVITGFVKIVNAI